MNPSTSFILFCAKFTFFADYSDMDMVPKFSYFVIFLALLTYYCNSEYAEDGGTGTADNSHGVIQGNATEEKGVCVNHFAEFFYQISMMRNARLSAQQAHNSIEQAWFTNSFRLFELSELLRDLNRTEGNDTQVDTTPSPKFECKPKPDVENGSVILVNSTELIRIVSYRSNSSASGNETDKVAVDAATSNETNKSSESVCVIVMFYAASCRFSAETAPEYNALGRAFAGVDVLAFDINQSNGINSRYGIVAVPSIVLFHNNKLVARFNDSKRTLENITSFIHNLTGLPFNATVTVSSEDGEGPVPTVAVIGPDYFLWFSNIFLFFCGLGFLQQKVGAAVRSRVMAIRDYVMQVWRTGEFYEQVGIAENEHEEVPRDNDPVQDR